MIIFIGVECPNGMTVQFSDGCCFLRRRSWKKKPSSRSKKTFSKLLAARFNMLQWSILTVLQHVQPTKSKFQSQV